MLFARAPGCPLCRYGDSCYRQNPAHWRDYDHNASHPYLAPAAAAPPPVPAPAPAQHVPLASMDSGQLASASTAAVDNGGPPAKRPRIDDDANDDALTEVGEDDDATEADDEETDEDEPAAPDASTSTVAPGQPDTLGPLADGETEEVQGSAAEPYKVKRTGAVYSCSCPAWRNHGGGVMRTCKHIKGLRGEDAERERLGGDAKAFYASGNKVAGQAGGSSGGGASSSSGGADTALAKTFTLAQTWDGNKDVAGWLVSEKLDGQRCLWDGKGGLWTRTGNVVYAPQFLVDALPADVALDGELWLGRGNFQALMSIVRRQDRPEAEWRKVTFVVFDAPRAPGGIGDRLEAARAAIATKPAAPGLVRLLEHEVVRDALHVRTKQQEVEANGGEGLMLRHPTAAHRGGRTAELLKVKSSHDDEALVTAHEPGKGKHTGRLGALVCKLRSGKAFKIGTGFSDAQREAPPAIGSVVTFSYFELTKANVPRFPAYVRIRPDVDPSVFP